MNTPNTLGVAPSNRRFHLDEDLLPDHVHYCDHAAYLNHGRNIVRNAAGRWIAAVVSDRGLRRGNFLTLHVSDGDHVSQGSQFPEPIFLIGPLDRYGKPHVDAGDVANVALALTDDDRLHVVVEREGGVLCFAVDASGADVHARLADPASWPPPCAVMQGAHLGDALIDADGRLAVYVVRGEDLYESIDGGDATLVAPRAIHPSVFVEPDGTTHVAFERDRRVYYTRRAAGGAWCEPELAAHWCSSWPSLVVTGGRVLIVYQGEGKVDLKRYPDLAVGLRPNGGSTVSFAIRDGKRWTQTDYLRSSQIMLKRKASAGLAHADEIFSTFMEEFWRPSLAIDRHGVAWMFFANTTRRHVFFARWQGETFGVHHEARGAYDAMSRIMLLQKDARRSDRIGFMTHATRRFYFDAITVPSIDAARRRVVFLDNLEVDRAVNLEHRIGMWQKEPEPLLGYHVPGDFADEQIMWSHVEKVDGGFMMHYMGWGSGDSPIRANNCPGRAFSEDGYRWERRPPLCDDDMTLDGDNVGKGYWRPIGLRDDDEPDPRKRYKGLFVDWRYEEAGLVQTRTYKVVASPDGRAWHTVPDAPRVVIGDIVTPLQFMRDDEDEDPNRRYKITLCAGSHTGRGMAVYTSPDLIHWSKVNYLRLNTDDIASALSVFPTGPVVVDPDAAENPWEEENHDAVIWREHGHLMFHYDAFYFNNNQHTNKALAISRDGRHYWRILRGTFDMPHGACGDWDSGRDRSSKPVRVGDELWMWFAAGPASDYNHPEDDANGYMRRLRIHAGTPGDVQTFAELRPWRVGLAKLRVDGWAYMQLHRDADEGELTSIPFDTDGGSLIVNGTHLGSELTVELLDAHGNVVKGFSRGDCVFSDADSVNAKVTWTGGALPRGTHRVRFVFTGLRGKLYAFGLE